MTFGERLKELRKAKKLKQSDLAKELNISTQRISLYENGREPEYKILIALANYFGVLVDYLIGEEEFSTIEKAMSLQKRIDEVDTFLNEKTYITELYWDISDDNSVYFIYKDSQKIAELSQADFEHFKNSLCDYSEYLLSKYAQ